MAGRVQKVMTQPIVCACSRHPHSAPSHPPLYRAHGVRAAHRRTPCARASRAARAQNLIFRFLQNKTRIQVWLYEQTDLRIEGRIIGFDEYMNLVLDDAEEIALKKKSRKALGRILLKGDNITLLMAVPQ